MDNFEKRPELNGILIPNALPTHVGIIMDGNGRWAKAKGLPRVLGHRAGVERLRSVVRMTSDIGIKVLSIFAFSTENWKRPYREVDALMKLLIEFMNKEIEELDRNHVQMRFMGETDEMSESVRNALKTARERTAKNDGLILNIGLNYGSRAEILRAAQLLATDVANGLLTVAQIDESTFASKLYSAQLPDLDLVIRTSGERRLSNFMLFQIAYAELIFTSVHWPDFDDAQYLNVLKEYQNRDRRFGGL